MLHGQTKGPGLKEKLQNLGNREESPHKSKLEAQGLGGGGGAC